MIIPRTQPHCVTLLRYPAAIRRYNSDSLVRKVSLRKDFAPLRILFCGSDEFSAVSLKHLFDAQKSDENLIQSIDVVCKQGKPSGRGLKNIREVPIKKVAQKLGLKIHEIPTFRGWTPPQYGEESISLIIAVSFGLLVPPRILNIATYGGLNLHPSLLPAFRGPAPLQHTLLHDIRKTGLTVQTLHPQKYDHGEIIAQDPLELQDNIQETYVGFRDYMAERGAKLLVDTLRRGSFVPPYTPPPRMVVTESSSAPKLSKEDAHINWQEWSADRILRAQKVMGTLWSFWTYDALDKASGKIERKSLRIQWHDLGLRESANGKADSTAKPGMPAIYDGFGAITTCDSKLLSPGSVTLENRKRGWPGDSEKTVEMLLDLASTALTGGKSDGMGQLE